MDEFNAIGLIPASLVHWEMTGEAPDGARRCARCDGACWASRRLRPRRSFRRCSAARGREVTAIASRDLRQGDRPRPTSWASRRRTARTRNCSPTRTSTRSTTRCRIICTCPGRSRAAERGKHVLCEKPIALTAAEARELLAVRERTGVKMQEAFMVRTHPQWLRAQEIVARAGIGELPVDARDASATSTTTPANIRNVAEFGGGGADGHRLLPDQHIAVHLRSRAARVIGADRARSGDRAPIG